MKEKNEIVLEMMTDFRKLSIHQNCSKMSE